ncbi:MAG: DUF5698 domain-containing protein [Candidatus Komeilibacteria bacterium]|nr:DUF5698 domain-containing protein [Candidatus Komeilibacteria bacterium]
MYYYLIIYFFAGMLQDFLVTLNWRFVAKDKPYRAATFSFTYNIVYLLVLYNILTQLNGESSIVAIVVYSLGIGSGTILGMKAKIKKNKN